MNLNPTIVTFSQGDILPETVNKLQFDMVEDEDSKSVLALIASHSNNKNVYHGKLDQSPYCNNFLVIRNKKKNCVRFFATNNYLMSPHLENELNKLESEKEPPSSRDALLNLNKAMGSKRSKKRVKEIESSNVSMDNIEKKLKKAIETKELNISDDIEMTCTINQDYLPPCNRTASSVEQVYNIYDLMSKKLLNNLEEIANQILDNGMSDLPESIRLSQFFLNSLSKVPSRDPVKVKMLLYANALLNFLKITGNQFRKKDLVVCNYSEHINEKIISDFTTVGINGSRQRPPTLRDKTICYILVLLFLVYNFISDVSLLSGHIAPKDYLRLQILMKALGARPERNSSTIYCLKLPLAGIPATKVSGAKLKNFNKSR